MGFDARGLLGGLSLIGAGIIAASAWRHGLWGTVCGATLLAAWLLVERWWQGGRLQPTPARAAPLVSAATPRLLLDAAPTPLVGIEDGRARALNRAARRLFATDARILTAPAALFDPAAAHLRHEGRSWRIDRVALDDGGGPHTVAALVDIEQEERTAEARAAAELIQVLGHELLNGLAPIASLAESGAAAIDRPNPDPALLREIFVTLARRAEGLLRFTEAYRALARLPPPTVRPVMLDDMAGDLARLFAGRWPTIALTVAVPAGAHWPLDRDQVSQALWALLQNAAEAVGPSPAAVALRFATTADTLAIAVEDEGSGIEPSQASLIFRPFHTGKPGGTGVGLSLARQIAHAHGGTLTLDGGLPTTFRLVLPAAHGQNPQ